MFALLLLLAELADMLPAGALASFPGGNGVIAYSAEGSIWELDPATGDQLQLTSGHDDGMPSFSPSGDWLAFQRTVGGSSTVFVVKTDGSDATALTSGREPSFSPDGRRLVFVRQSGLFVTGATPGSSVHRLTARPGDSEPRWSSTGTIVFERVRVMRVRRAGVRAWRVVNELDTIAPPGRSLYTLLSYEQPETSDPSEVGTALHPDWSPASTKIAAALCNEAADTHIPFHTVPAFVLRGDCAPEVWAPSGGGFAVPGRGALSGSPGTSCPHQIGEAAEISWQPVGPGTLRVPTVPCQPRPATGPETGVSPSRAFSGSRTCYYDRRRHRRRCFN